MIIWISGPYGVGKSTLAEAMAAKMPSSSMQKKWVMPFGETILTVPMVTYLRIILCGVNSATCY